MAEGVLHFGAIRIRLQGSGNLVPSWLGLDTIANPFTAIPMHATPNNEPTRLCNFKNQRARLELETTEIDDHFDINRIIIYAKPLWADLPTLE